MVLAWYKSKTQFVLLIFVTICHSSWMDLLKSLEAGASRDFSRSIHDSWHIVTNIKTLIMFCFNICSTQQDLQNELLHEWVAQSWYFNVLATVTLTPMVTLTFDPRSWDKLLNVIRVWDASSQQIWSKSVHWSRRSSRTDTRGQTPLSFVSIRLIRY